MDARGAVAARLAALGYCAAGEDAPALDFLIARCEAELLAAINHRTLPEGLFCTLVDMAAGAFLREKLAAGALEMEGLDFSQQPKSITEGDVSVSFGGEDSAEARFLAQLDRMTHPPERLLGAYRRVRW